MAARHLRSGWMAPTRCLPKPGEGIASCGRASGYRGQVHPCPVRQPLFVPCCGLAFLQVVCCARADPTLPGFQGRCLASDERGVLAQGPHRDKHWPSEALGALGSGPLKAPSV